jgi:hypothetical protein
MKKILITLFLFSPLVSFLSPCFSQEDVYRIEQSFPVAIRQLTLVEGWTLHLVYTPGEDSTHVAVVTPCAYYFAEGKEPTIVKLDGDKLHIMANRTMPPGTLVEVRYPKPIESVIATGYVQLDTLHMLLRSEGPRAAAVMSAGRNSKLKINCLISDGDIGVECRDEGSKVEIGTVRCRQLFVDERQQQRVKTERMESDNLVVVPHHWWDDINWNNNIIILDLKMGAASLMSRESTPYSSTMIMSYDIKGRLLEIPLPHRWRFKAEFGSGFEYKMLSYDVLLDGNRLVFNPNHAVDHPLTFIGQCYLSLPLKLEYRPKKLRMLSNYLSFRLTPMLNLGGDVSGYRDGSFFSKNTNLFSRFQLRLGVSNTFLASVRGDVVSDGISWELFVDLLPTYRPSAGARGLHQIGFVFHL